MIKTILTSILFTATLFSHPVNYTIDLEASYDTNKKEALIVCKSDNRNKCGLHNIYLKDENDKTIGETKYPFMKKDLKIKMDKKPHKLVFYLRSTPEHNYIIYFK